MPETPPQPVSTNGNHAAIPCLQRIRTRDDLSLRAPVDPFTEIGQIARKYNRMMDVLQSTVAKTEAILHSVGDGIVTFEKRSQRVTSMNPAACLLFGYSSRELGEQTIGTFLPDVPMLFGRGFEAANSSSPGLVLDLQGRRKDGSLFHADVSLTEVDDDTGTFYTTVVRDVSEKRRADVELRRSKAEIEKAYADLQAAKETLVQSERLASLGGLVAGVAHEINTPLGITLGTASHLEEQADQIHQHFLDGTITKREFSDFIADVAQATALLVSNTRRAAELVQSFKQVAVDQSSEGRRTFDLRTYIDETLRSLAPTIKYTPHKIHVDCPDGIELDSYPGPFAQVLTNLIQNSLLHAFDHTPQGEMRLHARRAPNNTVELVYSDNGGGIPRENLPRLFEPFFTTKRNAGGSGLGLYIIYNIVTQKLRGQIEVKSTVGAGTEFRLVFPVSVSESGAGHVFAGNGAGRRTAT